MYLTDQLDDHVWGVIKPTQRSGLAASLITSAIPPLTYTP
jgi:hypothetical protein